MTLPDWYLVVFGFAVGLASLLMSILTLMDLVRENRDRVLRALVASWRIPLGALSAVALLAGAVAVIVDGVSGPATALFLAGIAVLVSILATLPAEAGGGAFGAVGSHALAVHYERHVGSGTWTDGLTTAHMAVPGRLRLALGIASATAVLALFL